MDTMAELAKRAGVSVSTVSRALAGNARISEAVRVKIARLAAEAGYSPNLNAKALRSGSGTGLALIVEPGATQAASLRSELVVRRGQELFSRSMVCLSQPDESLDKAISLCLASDCRCVVASSCGGAPGPRILEELKRRGVPLLSLDSDFDGQDSIRIDRAAGMYQAARLLLLSGSKAPAFFSFASPDAPNERLRGIAAAFKSLSLPLSDVRLMGFSLEQGPLFQRGFALAKAVLESHPVDALFCSNDEIAIGALKAAASKGLRVPEDLRVVGFDDIPVADFAPVPLTTVRQPVAEAVELAFSLLAKRLESPDAPPESRLLPATLVVRDSAPASKELLSKALDMRAFAKSMALKPSDFKRFKVFSIRA